MYTELENIIYATNVAAELECAAHGSHLTRRVADEMALKRR